MRLAVSLAGLLLCLAPAAAQTRAVTFEVVVPGVLAPLDTVYLAGTLNGWNPGDGIGDSPDMGDALPMAPVGERRFRLTVDVPDGAHAYKYTLGSWRSVERTAATGERPDRVLAAAATIARDTVAEWALPSVALGAWRVDDLFPQQGAAFQRWAVAHRDALAGPLDAAGVDALVARAEAAWAAEAATQGLPPLPLLPGLFGPFSFGPTPDGGLDVARAEHVLRAHVVPRQTALLEAFEREPVHAARVAALGVMRRHLAAEPLAYVHDAASAERFAGLAGRVVALAARYCEAARAGFADLAEAACGAADGARGDADVWALVSASAAGRSGEATDGFERLVRGGIETADDPTLVLRLTQRHAERAPVADRLRLLDALLTTTSDRFTDADTLRAAYVAADPAGGAARFERLLPRRPVVRLPVVEGAPRLDGLMPDVVARGAFDLDALAGRLVLLDVWATWCGPCLAEIPTFNALHDALADRDDVAFVSLLADARTGGLLPFDAEAFVAEHGVRYPALYDLAGDDEALGAALGVFGYPSAFLVYPDGSIRAVPMDLGWRRALALATAELGLAPVDIGGRVEP